jgi:hypothetical protein
VNAIPDREETMESRREECCGWLSWGELAGIVGDGRRAGWARVVPEHAGPVELAPAGCEPLARVDPTASDDAAYAQRNESGAT